MSAARIGRLRAARRRIPSEGALATVRWDWSATPARTGALLALPAGATLFVAALAFALLPRIPPAPGEEPVVWIEEPVPVVQEAAEEVPPPRVPHPPEPELAPPVPATPAPLEPSPPVADPPSDPAFGPDDAVSTGGVEVASGSTLDKAPDPVVRGPEPPSGPVLVDAVPASASPVIPRYPARAEEMGIEADVVALVTTDASGNVVDVRIERSGGRDFDESVRRAVLSTKFVVPVREGLARSVAFRLPYRFRLD